MGSLDFGWVDSLQAVWQKAITFKLYNNGDSSKDINLAVANTLPEGITIEFSETNYSIASNSSVDVQATMEVDTSVVKPVESVFPVYQSSIEITGDSQLTIPVNVFYSPLYSIAITGLEANDSWGYTYRVLKDGIYIDSGHKSSRGNSVNVHHLPSGNYDIVITMSAYSKQKEYLRVYDSVQIGTEKGFQIKLDNDEIQGKIQSELVDINGVKFAQLREENKVKRDSFLSVVYKNTGERIQSMSWGFSSTDDYYVTANTEKFDIQGYVNYYANSYQENFFIPFIIENGLDGLHIITNDKSDYESINLKYGHIPDLGRLAFADTRFQKDLRVGDYHLLDENLTSSVEYVIPASEDYSVFRGRNRALTNIIGDEYVIFANSPTYQVIGDEIRYFDFKTNKYTKKEKLEDIDSIQVGRLVPYWGGQIIKTGINSVSLTYSRATNNALFSDSSSSFWEGNVAIKCDTCWVKQEEKYNKFIDVNSDNDYVTLGSYGSSNIEFNFTSAYLDEKPVTALAELSFDANSADFSPPYLTGIDTLQQDKLSPNLTSEAGKVRLKVRDDVAISSVSAQIKREDVTSWQDVELIMEDDNYVISLEEELQGGYYGIRLVATDSSDNSLTYTVSPAFSVNICPNDQDCDGVPDDEDAFPLDASETTDTDGDGIGNNADTDDDNDGVEDSQDAFPLDASETTDTDGDGIGNNADTDDDNDGVEDSQDAFPLDASETTDTDGDGIGNNADNDDDNDGVLDSQDAYPLDSSRSENSNTQVQEESSSGGSLSYLFLLQLLALRLLARKRKKLNY